MFEQQYDDEMTAEILRLEGKQRAAAAGHPEWEDACPLCRSPLALGAVCDCAAAAAK